MGTSGQTYSADIVPVPDIPEERARMWEAATRESFLTGSWTIHAYFRMLELVGRQRTKMAGPPNISSNLINMFIEQVGIGYDNNPTIAIRNKSTLKKMNQHLTAARNWPLGQDMMRHALATNEAIRFYSWKLRDPNDLDSPGRLSCELIPVSQVFGEPMPDDPTKPGIMYWARPRMIADATGKLVKRWTWDVWNVLPNGWPLQWVPPVWTSIGDQGGEPFRPYFRVLSADFKTDLTDQIPGADAWQSDTYSMIADDGWPVHPMVVFHSRTTGKLFDPWRGQEVVDGTLRDSLRWTMLDHVIMRASWSQRLVLGGRLEGAETVDAPGGPVQVLQTDPSKVLSIASADGVRDPKIGEWGSPVDIEKMERAVARMASRLAVNFGIAASDVQIDASKFPQSGVALTVSRAGQRRISARMMPHFEVGDLQSLAVVAAILRDQGIKVPDKGWSITYGTVALSTDERRSLGEAVIAEKEAGITTRAEARRAVHPAETVEETAKALAQIDSEKSNQTPATPAEQETP